ncbi:hypothetical protein ACEQPO_03260 [Bacillus sp. SL00103]
MKSVKWMFLILALSLAIQPFFMASQAMAQSISTSERRLGSLIKGNQTETKHLSEDVVTLYGQEDRTEFSIKWRKKK